MDLEKKLFGGASAWPRYTWTEPRARAALEALGFAEADGVSFKGISSAEKDRYEKAFYRVDGKGRPRPVNDTYGEARLVALCLVGPDDKRFVRDANVSRLASQFPSSTINDAFKLCAELSGITKRDEEELASQLAKNPDDAEPSNSPNGSASGTLTVS